MSSYPLYSVSTSEDGGYQVGLTSPLKMPMSTGYLWNDVMMLQVNCRGYATAMYMQPEPAKYAYSPNIEAKTFMQPEQPYYAHHPGRFFYIKIAGEVFSLPFAPANKALDNVEFICKKDSVEWQIKHMGFEFCLTVKLLKVTPTEQWCLNIKNCNSDITQVEIYPYFPIGYMSWMYQEANFNSDLNAIVARSITPYQKVEQYSIQKNFKDLTYLISDKKPTSWAAKQSSFEGFADLSNPAGVTNDSLAMEPAIYETPTAVMHYVESIEKGNDTSVYLMFGAAKSEAEIAEISSKLAVGEQNFLSDCGKLAYEFQINSQDIAFDAMINQWLPRQIHYHQDLKRLTTDPQTRNLLQDCLGMVFISPDKTRDALLLALSQQHSTGEMPDGILLNEEAELKYINQVPHADHAVWLPIVLLSYLNETNDKSILKEQIDFVDSARVVSVQKHIELAIDNLLDKTDKRGLSLIEQGDWCDPMNMVGYKGSGVSAWLSMATAYAINCWAEICQYYLPAHDQQKLEEYRFAANALSKAINQHFWYQSWFGRGITDDGRLFGTKEDKEGQIYLNAQSWAILSGVATNGQIKQMIDAIESQLISPYGAMMLAPSYTKMQEDIGRLTQKFPGVAENGSVYNHASVFYIYALYQIGEKQRAYDLIKAMLPTVETAEKTGQLPVFIPNYYRGAYHQIPSHAGRSSQLVHTGTVAWLYRCIIEELCGLKGSNGELTLVPQLPKELDKLSGTRKYLGAEFEFAIKKQDVKSTIVYVNGDQISGNIINNIQAGSHYKLEIIIPTDDE